MSKTKSTKSNGRLGGRPRNRAQTFIQSVESFKLGEMAIDRSQFMTKIQEKLIGALREKAFVLLAKKNNQTKWVEHKENEVERLKLELLDIFDLEIKGKWDQHTAAIQAVEYYRDKLKTFVTKAFTQYPRYYGVEPKKMISAEDLLLTLEDIIQSIP